MGTKCPKCARELEFKYVEIVIAQGSAKCPSCRANFEESKTTKIIALLLAMIPIFFLAYFIKNFILRVIIIFIWAFVINLCIRPAIAKFSLVKK